jgi:hypothetical protein
MAKKGLRSGDVKGNDLPTMRLVIELVLRSTSWTGLFDDGQAETE